jgi:hypothetical protein
MLDSAIKHIAIEFGRIGWRENGAGRPFCCLSAIGRRHRIRAARATRECDDREFSSRGPT